MGISSKLLDSRDLPEIFKEIYLQQLDGTLFAERLKYKRCVYFKGGVPIFATSNLSEDKIGKILFTQEKVSMDQLLQALDRAKTQKKRLGAVLVELQYISPQDLFGAVIYQVEQIVTTLFSSDWKRAHLTFDDKSQFGDEVIRLSLHPVDIILSGVRQSYGVEMIAANVGAMDTVYQRTDHFTVDLDDTKLSEEEKRFCLLMDGEADLGVLCETSELSQEKAYVLAFTLKMLGAIEPVGAAADETNATNTEAVLANPEGPEPVVVPGAAPKAAKPASTRKISTQKSASSTDPQQALVAEATQMRHRDFYGRLGVNSDVSRDEIVMAHGEQRERFSHAVAAESEKAWHAAVASLDIALLILGNDGLRRKYDSLLGGGSTAGEAEHKIRQLAGRERFESGTRAWRQKHAEEAEKAFRQALELDPAPADYYIGLGLVLVALERGAPDFHEAAAAFSKATVLQPDHPRGYYYLGTVLRHRGETQKAADAYRQALELDSRYEPAREGLERC